MPEVEPTLAEILRRMEALEAKLDQILEHVSSLPERLRRSGDPTGGRMAVPQDLNELPHPFPGLG